MSMDVYPFMHPGRVRNGPLVACGSTAVCAVVGALSKLFVYAGTRLHTHNTHVLDDVVWRRAHGRPLITVCNHASTIDDPALWGLLRMRTFVPPTRLRWSLGAQEICYKNKLRVYQAGMDCAVDKLNEGGWVHIFPEAKVHQEDYLLPFRWGVARLIMDCDVAPLVVPIYHAGLAHIHPLEGGPLGGFLPRFFQPLHISVGEPIDTAGWRLEVAAQQQQKSGWRARDSRIWITQRVERAMHALKEDADRRIAAK
ncbi:Lyso-phosphatidylcholine acyltransferase [Sorochytrium milnesiophthora]